MKRYQVLLQLDWQQHRYITLDANSDEHAIQLAVSAANGYINSGEKPRLISAFVSRWSKPSKWSRGMWMHVKLLQRGRDLYLNDPVICPKCEGKGVIRNA